MVLCEYGEKQRSVLDERLSRMQRAMRHGAMAGSKHAVVKKLDHQHLPCPTTSPPCRAAGLPVWLVKALRMPLGPHVHYGGRDSY